MQKVMLMTFLLCVGASAAAQSDRRRNPADAQARVPAVEYRSAFADYRTFREPEVESWREANDRVRDLGGHKGMAKPEAAPTEKPAAGGHAGHH
jgi:hypothetical protein